VAHGSGSPNWAPLLQSITMAEPTITMAEPTITMAEPTITMAEPTITMAEPTATQPDIAALPPLMDVSFVSTPLAAIPTVDPRLVSVLEARQRWMVLQRVFSLIQTRGAEHVELTDDSSDNAAALCRRASPPRRWRCRCRLWRDPTVGAPARR
jgi:hypothetical protein